MNDPFEARPRVDSRAGTAPLGGVVGRPLDPHPPRFSSTQPVSSVSLDRRTAPLWPCWVEQDKHWAKDAINGSPTSYDLLLQFFETQPHSWARFHGGFGGASQSTVSVEIEAWLRKNHCPTKRTAPAITRRVSTSTSGAHLLDCVAY